MIYVWWEWSSRLPACFHLPTWGRGGGMNPSFVFQFDVEGGRRPTGKKQPLRSPERPRDGIEPWWRRSSRIESIAGRDPSRRRGWILDLTFRPSFSLSCSSPYWSVAWLRLGPKSVSDVSDSANGYRLRVAYQVWRTISLFSPFAFGWIGFFSSCDMVVIVCILSPLNSCAFRGSRVHTVKLPQQRRILIVKRSRASCLKRLSMWDLRLFLYSFPNASASLNSLLLFAPLCCFPRSAFPAFVG